MKARIVLVGIGGQGVLFATRLLEQAGLARGLPVIGSETHGMSQRGGSVVSYLKLGGFHGPLVERGRADLLYGLARDETIKGLPYLAKAGTCFANLSGLHLLPQPLREATTEAGLEVRWVDALGIASSLGSPKLTNVVLVAASSTDKASPFSTDEYEAVLRRISPPRFLEPNLRAFEAGVERGVAGF